MVKAIVTDYYDGALQGAASLACDLRVFRFDAVAWDIDSNVRVYAFAPIQGPGDSIWNELEQALRPQPPEWPFWYPSLQTSDGRPDGADEKVKAILDRAVGYESIWMSGGLEESGSPLVALPDGLAGAAEKTRQTGEVGAVKDWAGAFEASEL
ncbi:MAG: hypothetical protein JNL98_39445 [Bryobacterales bacterium]|nr:hypothetical protein [Bryobacterales bacterium]